MADLKRMTRKKLGELLISEGLVTREQVDQALEEQKKSGELLGEILVAEDLVTENDIAATIARQFSVPYMSTDNYEIAEDAYRYIPSELLQKGNFIPLDKFGDILTIIIGELLDQEILTEIETVTRCEIQVFVGISSDVNVARKGLIKKIMEAGPIEREPSEDVPAETAAADDVPTETPDMETSDAETPAAGMPDAGLEDLLEEDMDEVAKFVSNLEKSTALDAAVPTLEPVQADEPPPQEIPQKAAPSEPGAQDAVPSDDWFDMLDMADQAIMEDIDVDEPGEK